MTAEEMLAAYLENPSSDLVHFNTKHDAKGRFAKKTGGTASYPKQPPSRTSSELLALYGMSTSKIPRDSFRYNGDPRPLKDSNGVYNKSDRSRMRSDIISQMTSSMIGQLHDTGSWFDPKNSKYARYGNNLISATSENTSDPNLIRSNLKRAMTSELLTAYKNNVVSPALRIKDEDDEAEVEQLIRDTVDVLVEKEVSKRGREAMVTQMNREKAEASKSNGKKGAKITIKDRIEAAYKEASTSAAGKVTPSVNTFKMNVAHLIDKVGDSARKGKDKTVSIVSKGTSYLKKMFE